MRKETNTENNSTVGVAPAVPWRVRKVQPLNFYRLHVEFIDGLEGFVDLSELITGDNAGVFTALRDKNVFQNVYIDHGAVTWPGELDLAPDAMHSHIKQQGEWILQ